MFCGNDKVLDGMIISLLSIVKHCKKTLNVYILTMDLQEMNEKYKELDERFFKSVIYKRHLKVK